MKYFSILLFLIISCSSVFAQFKAGFHIGPYFTDGKVAHTSAGVLNYPDGYSSAFSVSTTRMVSSNLNFGAGIIFEINIKDFLFFQTEVNYIKKGIDITGQKIYSEKHQNGNTMYYVDLFVPNSKFTIDYFEIPFLIKAKFYSDPLFFSFMAGPSVGIKNKIEINWKDYKGNDQLFKLDEAKYNLSLFLSGGVEIPASSIFDVTVDFYYFIGLKDIEKENFNEFKLNGFGLFVGTKLLIF